MLGVEDGFHEGCLVFLDQSLLFGAISEYRSQKEVLGREAGKNEEKTRELDTFYERLFSLLYILERVQKSG